MGFSSRKKLERRILDSEGNLQPDVSLKEFAEYVGYRRGRDEEGLSFSAYLNLCRFGGNITIGDLGKIREYGLKRVGLMGIGEKKAEELNLLLSRYGIAPIPWTTKKYGAWELRKELKKKFGKYIERVYDLLKN